MSVVYEERTSGTLIDAVREMGDSASWNKFVQLYVPMFRVWLKKYELSNECKEDIIGEVYCKLVVNLPKFMYDPRHSFRGWLHRIVDNAALDSLRRDSRKKKLQMELIAGADLEGRIDSSRIDSSHYDNDNYCNSDDDDSSLRMSERLEARMAVVQAVVRQVRSRAASTTWEAFFLKEIEGWSGERVAAHLGIPVQNVYVYAFRIRKMLDDAKNSIEPQSS